MFTSHNDGCALYRLHRHGTGYIVGFDNSRGYMRISLRIALSTIVLISMGASTLPTQAQTAAPTANALQDEINALRSKVKYVFVLYQENRSFDSYFGTFPGADGIYSQPAAVTAGYNQSIMNTDGTMTTINPFLIGPQQYASDTDDIDHSHGRIVSKMNVTGGVPLMNQFARTEELKYSPTGNPSLKAKQFGELSMAYEDCTTVPFLWQYAKNFALYDHMFQSLTGPSTPGNLAIIGAQSGQTQYVLHPDQAYQGNGNSGPGVPVLNDADPFWGSQLDKTTTGKMPVNPGDFSGTPPVEYSTQLNLTFATLPLTLAGPDVQSITQDDQAAGPDLADVQNDIPTIMQKDKIDVPWRWYEEGFDKEPTDPNGADPVDANGTHASYITHHNGPQYFGYIANNPKEASNMQGLSDLMTALDQQTLPGQGGLFYVKGGSRNIHGLKPADPSPIVQKNFLGDDDHPAYSDAQISEAMLATVINKIARSQYWNQSAIIITYDDSEGDYDHVPPPITATGPNSQIITDGPRVPFLLLSPFARTGYIDHEQGDTGSVIKFVDTLFGLTPLATLPDELHAREIGMEKYGQQNLGPNDALTTGVSDLISGFDPDRLSGKTALVPASQVEIADNIVNTLPQQSGYGCKDIGIVPVDQALNIHNPIPSDFNPRPNTEPGVPNTPVANTVAATAAPTMAATSKP